MRIILVLIFALIPLSAANATIYDFHPDQILYLGAGFEPTDLAKGKEHCINYEREFQLDVSRQASVNPDADKDPFASSTNFTISQIRTQRDFYRYMHLSASVSGHYSMFSGGANFSLTEENSSSSESFSWILRVESDYGRFGMVGAKLTDEAAILSKNDLAAFRIKCGTEFVSQVRKSVFAAAVYTVKNLNESSRRDLQASFNAGIGGGVWGVNMSADYKEFIKQAAASGSLDVNVYLVGGDGIKTIVPAIKIASDIDLLKDTLVTYVNGMGPKKSVPISYVTTSMSALAPNLANIDFDYYTRTISNLFFIHTDLTDRSSRLYRFLMAADDYGLAKPDWDVWKARYNEYEAAKREVLDTAIACRLSYSSISAASAMATRSGERISLELQSKAFLDGSKLQSLQQASNELSMLLNKSSDKSAKPVPNPVDAPNPSVHDACRYDAEKITYDLAGDIPSKPYAITYSVSEKIDATNQKVYTLMYSVAGKRVDQGVIRDSKGSIRQVSNSTSSPDGAFSIGGTIDVTGDKAQGASMFTLEIRMISGRTYSYPFTF